MPIALFGDSVRFAAPAESRNNKDFPVRYRLAQALQNLPDETVVDGEILAFHASGHTSFNTLQNYGSSKGPIFVRPSIF